MALLTMGREMVSRPKQNGKDLQSSNRIDILPPARPAQQTYSPHSLINRLLASYT